MELLDDASRDRFFAELYELTTAPFVTAESTLLDVRTALALLKPVPGATIVDLACGWGRHLALLRQQGFRAIGIERSELLAAKAHAAVPGAVIRADLRALPLLSASVDAAVCFYSSLFFFDEAENLKALSEAARVLKPGGALFLQTANPIYLRRQGAQQQVHPLKGGATVLETAEFDSATGREHGFRRLTRADGTTLEGRYSVRYYAPGKLEALAYRAGVKVERVCGGHDLSPLGRSSRDLLAVLRKPA